MSEELYVRSRRKEIAAAAKEAYTAGYKSGRKAVKKQREARARTVKERKPIEVIPKRRNPFPMSTAYSETHRGKKGKRGRRNPFPL
jgi:hypothetical protein